MIASVAFAKHGERFTEVSGLHVLDTYWLVGRHCSLAHPELLCANA